MRFYNKLLDHPEAKRNFQKKQEPKQNWNYVRKVDNTNKAATTENTQNLRRTTGLNTSRYSTTTTLRENAVTELSLLDLLYGRGRLPGGSSGSPAFPWIRPNTEDLLGASSR